MKVNNGENNTTNLVPIMKKLDKLNVVGKKVKKFPKLTFRTIWRVGKEDPRRVIHSIKVGVSLTLVSLLYLMEPLFKGFGSNAIWAVMTVVVVLEFTAGATLCKGLNRGLGTLLAGSLAFLIEYVATKTGHIFRAIFIGAALFFIGATATYMRFFPYIKKNYDYGVVIFLLTFNLITVSSYRVDNVLKIAHERFYTIAIGCGICLLMSLLIFPNWSGEDLHNFTASKFEGLAKSIEACVNEYFTDEEQKKDEENSSDLEDPIYNGYKTVLDSKSFDETLALYASWEPRHSRHCYKFPWQQYVKLGNVLRHFGYTIVALHGCLQTEIQTPRSVRAMFKDPCIRLAGEVTKALKELGDSIRYRRHCSPEILSDHLHQALHDLNKALKSQPKLFIGSKNKLTLATKMTVIPGQCGALSSSGDHKVSLSSVKMTVGQSGALSSCDDHKGSLSSVKTTVRQSGALSSSDDHHKVSLSSVKTTTRQSGTLSSSDDHHKVSLSSGKTTVGQSGTLSSSDDHHKVSLSSGKTTVGQSGALSSSDDHKVSVSSVKTTVGQSGALSSSDDHHKVSLSSVKTTVGQSGALSSSDDHHKVSLSSVKTDTSALLGSKLSKLRGSNNCERKSSSLRPTLSKIAITSLEFSEALPFAAFASLLVEIVARLDLVIEQVEELGRIAHFKDYDNNNYEDNVVVKIDKKHSRPLQNGMSPHDAGD